MKAQIITYQHRREQNRQNSSDQRNVVRQLFYTKLHQSPDCTIDENVEHSVHPIPFRYTEENLAIGLIRCVLPKKQLLSQIVLGIRV